MSEKPHSKGSADLLVFDTPSGPVVSRGAAVRARVLRQSSHRRPRLVPASRFRCSIGGFHLLQDSPQQVEATLDVLARSCHVRENDGVYRALFPGTRLPESADKDEKVPQRLCVRPEDHRLLTPPPTMGPMPAQCPRTTVARNMPNCCAFICPPAGPESVLELESSDGIAPSNLAMGKRN